MLIRRNGTFPPGGFPFTDSKTGKKFNGMEGDFDEIVRKIIDHRRANPEVYPAGEIHWFDVGRVGDELDKYQCDRLGNDPAWCKGGNHVPKQTYTKWGIKCPNCGSENIAESGCKTCGNTYKRYCSNCGLNV